MWLPSGNYRNRNRVLGVGRWEVGGAAVVGDVWCGRGPFVWEFGLVNVVNLVHEVIAECLLNDDKVSINWLLNAR